MAEENIGFQIVVQTNRSQQNVTTLKQDINALQAAIEKSSKTGLDINIDGFKKSIEEAKVVLDNLKGTLASLDSSHGVGREKVLQEELKIRQAIAKEQDKALNQEIKQMETAEKIALAEERRRQKILNWQYNTTPKGNQLEFGEAKKITGYMSPDNVAMAKDAFTIKQLPQLQTYASQISNLTKLQEHWWQMWKNTGDEVNKIKFNAVSDAIKKVSLAQTEWNNSIDNTSKKTEYLGSFLQKLRSHANWIVAGSVLSASIGAPYALIEGFTKLEEAMAGVKQVMPSIEHDQGSANKEMQEFVKISAAYGDAVEQVIDAGRSWARMYGNDVNTVNFLVSQSAKMATADNFSLAESVRGLESAMAQFGMKSQDINEIMVNSNRILDVWTKLSHNAGVSAQDLTQAVERAGSAANQTGVSFEFFNALVAAGVRNTARSGAEIGQMLKTVFSSVRSNKAVTELQAMNIEVYKIGENGEKSFRPVQDILLDVALKTQSTTKDVQALNQALSGGKWQWSKASAVFGDYQEILHNWELAVNSAGFTNEQVKVQMDTLSRKMKSLKSELDGLFGGVGTAGFGNFLKEQTQSLTDFTRGLRESSSTVYTLVADLVKLAGVMLIAKTAIGGLGFVLGVTRANQMLANGATLDGVKADALKISSTANVTRQLYAQNVANGMLAASTKSLTSVGALGAMAMANWPILLATIAYGIYSVIEAQGEQSRIQDQINGKSQEENELLLKQIEAGKQKEQFIETLASQYNKLSDSITTDTENTTENLKKQNEQNEILKILQRQTGLTADEIVKDGKIQMDIIDQIKGKNKEEAKAKLEENMAKMTSEVDATQQFITNTQARIDAMKSELKDVGVLGRAYQWLMGVIAKQRLSEADRLEQAAASGKPVQGLNDELYTPEQALARAAELRKNGDNMLGNSGQTGIDYLQGQIVNANANVSDLSGKILRTKGQLDAIENTNGGGIKDSGTVDDSGKKKKDKSGSNSNPPSDPAARITKDAYKIAQDKMFLEAKLASDKYSMALEQLSTKEALYGQTVANTVEGIDLKTRRVQSLTETEKKYTNEAEYLEGLINDQISTNDELQQSLGITKTAWDNLSKTEKADYRLANREFLEQYNITKAQVQAMNQYKEKASEVHKEISKITEEMVKGQFSGVFDEDKQRERRLSHISAYESIGLASMDHRNPLAYKQETAIKLDAEMQRYTEYQAKAKQLEKDFKDLYASEVQEAEAAVRAAEKNLANAQAMTDGANKTEALKNATDELTQATKNLDAAKNGDTAKLQANKDAQIANMKEQADSLKTQKELAQKTATEIKTFWADAFLEMGQSGTTFGDIFKNLMKQIEKDAVYSLFHIEHEASTATKILGKGKNSTGASLPSKGGKKGIGKAATGGVVNTPTLTGEEYKEEVVVPTEDNTQNSEALLGYANAKLGSPLTKPTEYVPYFNNPDIASSTVNVQVQQNQEHIDAIERQTRVMQSMLQSIIDNPGGNTTVVPVMTQVSSEDVLRAIQSNPSAFQAILGQQKSYGFR